MQHREQQKELSLPQHEQRQQRQQQNGATTSSTCVVVDDDDDERNNPTRHQRKSPEQTPKKHRIAMVCDFFYPKLGGVENHIYSLSYNLIQLGHKVIVITSGGHTATQQQNSNNNDNNSSNVVRRTGVRYLPGPLKVYYIPFVTMTDQDTVPTFMVSLPLVRNILLREQITIVHCHQATSVLANECIVYGAMSPKIKTVYTDHSLFSMNNDMASVLLNRILQISLCTADAIICVSYACRDNFLLRTTQQRRRIKRQRSDNSTSENKESATTATRKSPIVRVIPNAVSAENFMPPTMEQLYHRDIDGRIKISIISRLVYRKGVDLLVYLIPNICSEFEDVDFIIGGDGNKLLELQEMVEREQLQDRVVFLGSVQHENVPEVLCAGHIFLNCSLTESFCIAILEAACTGMKVVSTNVGGVPEVLPPDMIYLADPTVPALCHQLCRAIQDYRLEQQPEKNGSLNKSATNKNDSNVASLMNDLQQRQLRQHHQQLQQRHDRIQKMYSWERVAMETVHVYDTIMQQPDDESTSSLHGRLLCYYDAMDGGITGFVVAYIVVLTIEIWYKIVEYWQPRNQIDIVPDIPCQMKSNGRSGQAPAKISNEKPTNPPR